MTAGPHVVGAAFVDRDPGLVERHRQPFLKVHITVGGDQRTQPNVYSLTITGPFDAAGPGDTPSRRRIFTCRPADATPDAEAACAAEILSTLARRAYRRPVTDADVAVLLRFFEEGRSGADFDAGIEMALQRLLISPEFLLRIERDPEGLETGRPYLVSDLELASRLSFFLWSSLPDDALIDAAAAGTLRDPAVLESHVRRMLADPRSESLVTNFAAQWLYLRNLTAVLARLHRLPGLRRDAAASPAPGDRALLREHRPRGPQRARSADRRLHVRERAAGEALRHAGHLRQPLPAGRAAARQPARRPPRPREHPRRDRLRHAHVAGRPRQVGAGEPPRHAAAPAAPQRAAAQRGEVRRRALDARADGRAPAQSGVRGLPRADGSGRPVAGELRRHRALGAP